jgi:hypothetical protein
MAHLAQSPEASWVVPKGFVNVVAKYQGKVCTATEHRLYILKTDEDVAQPAHFVPFGGLNDRFFGLTVSDSTTYAVSEEGAYSLNPVTAKFNRIGPGGGTILPSRSDSRRIFLTTVAGLQSIHSSNGQWYSEGKLSQLPYFFQAMAEDENGDLFLCSENEGFYRVQLKKGAQPLFRDGRSRQHFHLRNPPAGRRGGQPNGHFATDRRL